MIPLDKDLTEKKLKLEEFEEVTVRVLDYIPNVLTSFNEKARYKIHISEIASTKKFIRPINQDLFIYSPDELRESCSHLKDILNEIKGGKREFDKDKKHIIDSTLYTIQQSIGIGNDLLINPNAARKHVGNRFEELMRVVFTAIGISNDKKVLYIPYKTDKGEGVYSCENDLILSPFDSVKSTNSEIDKNEIVVSMKTTSKDRMGKMFIDKMLLQRFLGHKQKVIGIFLNDVQRKGSDNIGHTLVSRLFMVYTEYLTELEGVYYLDPPPNAFKDPFRKHMKSFSELITKEVWSLLSS